MTVPTSVEFLADKRCPPLDAASAAFLCFIPKIFEAEIFYYSKLRNEVAKKFGIKVSEILVCGSAQFAFSFIKRKSFSATESDLDFAIISPSLYARYYDATLLATEGFSDNTKFSTPSDLNQFQMYLGRYGMIRPDLLPRCPEKTSWLDFFRQLSRRNADKFKSISAAIYVSEKAFLFKQIPCISAARGEVQ